MGTAGGYVVGCPTMSRRWMAISPVLELERKANGRSHLRFVVMASLFVLVVWLLLLVQDYESGSRRYEDEARVEVACVSRVARSYESRVEPGRCCLRIVVLEQYSRQ